MSTTSLKLSDELKSNIRDLAAHEKVSAHAFMVSALEGEVRRRRQRAAFEAEAEAAAAATDAGAPVHSLDEVERYLKDKLRARRTGEKVKRPCALADAAAPAERDAPAPAPAPQLRAASTRQRA